MLRRCASIVRGLRNRWLATCLVVEPEATERATWSSRRDSREHGHQPLSQGAHTSLHAIPAALTHGFRSGFLVDTGFAALAVAAAAIIIQQVRPPADAGEVAEPAVQTAA
jgi:hypothetical protein